MPCPVCGFTNPAGTFKCSACGTQLVAEPKPVARAGDAVCAIHKDTPALQPCGRCGTFYCVACLERAPDGQMYCVTCRSRSTLPWDQREQLGLMRAWWQTSKALMLEPTATLQSAPRDAPVGSSLVYALISNLVGFMPTLALYMVLIVGALVFATNESSKGLGGPGMALGGVGMVVALVFYIVLAIGIQIVSLFGLAGVEHLVLHLAGEREIGGYTATLRAHALGLAPFALGLIPICGFMVMGLWSLVLRCITLMHLQKVSAGKAVAAVLAPVIVLCGCGGLAYVFIIAAAVSAAGLSR
ncbi:MAG: hypothetical protein JNK82_02080 [Myxococcaceae bacterium]|nr:hypothetical protein [Myxococcaceae bacterium]